ncbi:MAG: hypothetical protein MJK04_09585 [Psychrosphaera sp.]|nr:hypothetical protein [Psychrosphaera sp.]
MLKLAVSALFLSIVSMQASADFTDCTDLLVGNISIYRAGNAGVSFKVEGSSSNSYALNFSGWNADAQKQALALLTTAQITGKKVIIRTLAAGGCSISASWQTVSEVHLKLQ